MIDEQMLNNVNQQPFSGVAPAVEYADIGKRFVAVLIDGILLSIAGFALNLLISIPLSIVSSNSSSIQLSASISNLLMIGLQIYYYVYYLTKQGATLGKQAMGIRVQKETTGANLTVVDVILREVVGKFISTLVLFLGWLWPLWDPKKQALHDKIAGTVVVRVQK